MVTGGTGFVGAHTVKALVEAGHSVRLLVRTPAKIPSVLGPLGVERPDHVVGEMTDPRAVEEAMEGCDAAVHCAAVIALDKRRAAEVLDANPRGAEVVLGTAVRLGLDPVVHVSSSSALFEPGLALLHADLPPTRWGGGYGRSKARAEEVARRLQEEGAPVAITYPGAVLGPPAGSVIGESTQGVVLQLRPGFVPTGDGAWSVIDVRDLAAIHLALMEPGRGPRRFMCGGTYIRLDRQAEINAEVTGRRFPVAPMPGVFLRLLGSAMDRAMQIVPFESMMTAEAMTILTRWPPTDDRAVAEELGVHYRDPVETFTASVAAAYGAGRLTARQAGRVAVRAAAAR